MFSASNARTSLWFKSSRRGCFLTFKRKTGEVRREREKKSMTFSVKRLGDGEF